MEMSCRVFVILVCVVISVSAQYKKSATVCFNRDLKANVCGKVKFGPCGRPKSNVNANFKDCGQTNIGGNVFQVLETAGRLGETFKLVGNRFKPHANCPPRPPSNNNDLSTETLCDSVIRAETKRPCYRIKPAGGSQGNGHNGGNYGGYGCGGSGHGGNGHNGGNYGGYGCGGSGHGGNGHNGGYDSSGYGGNGQNGGNGNDGGNDMSYSVASVSVDSNESGVPGGRCGCNGGNDGGNDGDYDAGYDNGDYTSGDSSSNYETGNGRRCNGHGNGGGKPHHYKHCRC